MGARSTPSRSVLGVSLSGSHSPAVWPSAADRNGDTQPLLCHGNESSGWIGYMSTHGTGNPVRRLTSDEEHAWRSYLRKVTVLQVRTHTRPGRTRLVRAGLRSAQRPVRAPGRRQHPSRPIHQDGLVTQPPVPARLPLGGTRTHPPRTRSRRRPGLPPRDDPAGWETPRHTAPPRPRCVRLRRAGSVAEH